MSDTTRILRTGVEMLDQSRTATVQARLANVADHLSERVDAVGWAPIPVPYSWECAGHGTPIYTNFVYPIPLDPPIVRTGPRFATVGDAVSFITGAQG